MIIERGKHDYRGGGKLREKPKAKHGFSKQARSRMKKVLDNFICKTIAKQALFSFITLTIPDSSNQSHYELRKRYLKPFLQKLRRESPFYVWRHELCPKTGDSHFHILTNEVKNETDYLNYWRLKTNSLTEIQNTLFNFQLVLATDIHKVANYIAKKPESSLELNEEVVHGNNWGSSENLKYGVYTRFIDIREVQRLRRDSFFKFSYHFAECLVHGVVSFVTGSIKSILGDDVLLALLNYHNSS